MSVEKFQRDTTDLFNYPSDENPTTQADYISAVKNWQETERNLVDSVLWQPDTDYAIGAVVKTPSIPSQYILVCTQAGTSGTEEPDYTDVSTGYSVSDGTAIWRVETIVSLDKVNDMFTNIVELIESGEALTGDMWSLDIEENMVANKDNIVPKTNGVSKLGTAEKRWGEIHVVTPTKGDNSEKVATTAYVQAELEDYVTLTELQTDYLPLTGGTMTGNITLADGGNPLSTAGGTMTGSIRSSAANMLVGTADDQLYRIVGATSALNGAQLILTGNNFTANPGAFTLRVNNASTDIRFVGKLDGSLQWNSKEIERVDTVNANYIRFESGLQIYWGTETGVTSSGKTVTYTAPFVSAPKITLGTTASTACYYTSGTSTSVVLRTATSSGGTTVIYVAVGYWK